MVTDTQNDGDDLLGMITDDVVRRLDECGWMIVSNPKVGDGRNRKWPMAEGSGYVPEWALDWASMVGPELTRQWNAVKAALKIVAETSHKPSDASLKKFWRPGKSESCRRPPHEWHGCANANAPTK